jgi:hypothetical protein
MAMFLIAAAAIVGGVLTAGLTIASSPLLALVAAPTVASSAALAAACYLGWRREPEQIGNADLQAQTDEMVAVLRSLTEQSRAMPGRSAAAGRSEAA